MRKPLEKEKEIIDSLVNRCDEINDTGVGNLKKCLKKLTSLRSFKAEFYA